MKGRSTLRFAVGTFDTWEDVQETIRSLTADGMGEDSFSCLGLQSVLASRSSLLPQHMSLRDLPFPATRDPTSASDGPLAASLAKRIASGSNTLATALSPWLIPRHAAHLQDAVAAGKIILWVRLLDNEDERRTCRSLLARSSDSVGVHDIVG